MKYYLYISDPKADMIFAQLPGATLEGLEGAGYRLCLRLSHRFDAVENRLAPF
jgi:hypothetical protein